ncbi:hypothetical protein [Bdellovibrio sp. HCB2-146]|uniref:hypothetical protein n=1 Tax=Bdellovibrio sp. HCB2-146 TaxID=3394362 RepID=UPI0039BD6DE7
MKKFALAVLLTISSQTFACPDLTGTYMVSSSDTLYVTQGRDESGITVYNFTTKNAFCRACEHRSIYRADGRTTTREFADRIRVEHRKISCDGDKLLIRQTAETFDRGRRVAAFTDHYDYSLNSRSGLVEEEIKDGQVYRTTTHYRLAP